MEMRGALRGIDMMKMASIQGDMKEQVLHLRHGLSTSVLLRLHSVSETYRNNLAEDESEGGPYIDAVEKYIPY